MAKTEPCLSVMDQVKAVLRPMTMACRALVQTRSSETPSRTMTMALSRPLAVRTMTMAGSRQSRADDDYGWVAPKPCGR